MIKDIVANLSVGVSRDVATDFAVSVAAALDSHLTGIAFRYEPLVPLTDRYGFPAEVMESQRVENEKAAKAAMAKFDEAARRAAVSAESRMLDVPVASAPAKVARRFDLAIMGQPEPETPAQRRMPEADIAHHLARHGVKVEVDSVVTVETDVASTILSHAADISADFLVMGGYGHSRLREFVLGGVTRGF
jgi:nucleotide-binding universal stress UspA family protein